MSRIYDSRSAIADGSGRAIINFGAPFIGSTWELTRLSISGGQTTVGEARFYLWSEDPANLVAIGTPTDNNVAPEDPPVHVPESVPIICVFVGAVGGAIVTARIEGYIVQHHLGNINAVG